MPYLKLPDGRFMEVPEGVSPEEARRKAEENYPMAFADTSKAQTGIGAAFGAGLRGAGSALSTAAAPIFGQTDEEIRQAERKREALEAERFRGTSLEDVKKAYRESGIFGETAKSAEQHGALRTLLGMWGEQAAQSLPQMGAAMAGGAGGAALGTAILPGVGTVIGGGLGALAANVPFFTGSNVQAQIRAQEEAGKQEPLSYGRAVAAALPQAGLEAAETLIPLGRLGVSKGLIAAIESLGAKRGEAELVKAAERSLLAASGRGAVKGIGVEVPVEIAQQVLERAQAGKSVLDRDAMNDYVETAVGTVGPGGVFGIAGGLHGRMQARGELDDLRRAQEAERVRVEAAEKQRQEALAKMPRGTQQGMFGDLEQFQGPPAPTEEQRNAQLTARQDAFNEFAQLRRHVESLEKQFEAAADNPEAQDQIAAALNRYKPALTEAGKRAKAAGVSDAEITGVLGAEPLDRRLASLDRALAKARSEGDFQKIESLNRQRQAVQAQRDKFGITQTTSEGQMSLFGEENAGRIADQENAFWEGEQEALQEHGPARTTPEGADLFGAQEQLQQEASARAEQEKQRQALEAFNRARQKQAEELGLAQNAEKMERMVTESPYDAVVMGAEGAWRAPHEIVPFAKEGAYQAATASLQQARALQEEQTLIDSLPQMRKRASALQAEKERPAQALDAAIAEAGKKADFAKVDALRQQKALLERQATTTRSAQDIELRQLQARIRAAENAQQRQESRTEQEAEAENSLVGSISELESTLAPLAQERQEHIGRVQTTASERKKAQKLQNELDTGVVHTDTAKLLGIQMPASAYSPLTPQERAEDARQRNQDRDLLRDTQRRQRMELQSGRGQDALTYAGMRSLEAVLNPAYGLQDNLQEAHETGQRIGASAKETLDTNENLTADQREELQGRVHVGEALAREAENLLREKHGITPTGAAAGPAGPVRGGFDLNQKPQAEAALKAIDARIAELEQQRTTEFPSLDLVDEAGNLTADGKRYVGNSATLHLLRKLREKAQAAASREERVSNPRARAAREAKIREAALFDLANIVDDLRKGEFTGSLPQTMLRKAEELRAKIVDSAVKEAEYRRQADGLAPMSVDEKTRLATQVNNQIDTLAPEAAQSYRTPSGAPMPRGLGRETPMQTVVGEHVHQMLQGNTALAQFNRRMQELYEKVQALGMRLGLKQQAAGRVGVPEKIAVFQKGTEGISIEKRRQEMLKEMSQLRGDFLRQNRETPVSVRDYLGALMSVLRGGSKRVTPLHTLARTHIEQMQQQGARTEDIAEYLRAALRGEIKPDRSMRAYVDERVEQMRQQGASSEEIDKYLRTLAEAQRGEIQRGMTISGRRSEYAQIQRTINEAVDTASNPEREEAAVPATEETATTKAPPTEQKGRVFQVPPSRPIGPPRSLFEDAQTRRAEQQRKENEALIGRLKEQILARMQELHAIVNAQEADIEKVKATIAKLRALAKTPEVVERRGGSKLQPPAPGALLGFIDAADITLNEQTRARIATGLLQQRGILQFLQSQKFSENLIKEDEKLVFLRDFMHRVENQINNAPLTAEQLERLQENVAEAMARAQASQTRPQVTLQERIEKALAPRIVRRTTVRTTPVRVSKAPEGSSLQKIEKRLQNARAKAREIGEKLGLNAQESLYPYSAPEKGYPTKESRDLEDQRQALLQQIRNMEMQMTLPVQEKTVEDVVSAVEQAAGESVALENVKAQAKAGAVARAARTDVMRFNVLAETLNAVRAAIKNLEKDLKAYKGPYTTVADKKARIVELAELTKQPLQSVPVKERPALREKLDALTDERDALLDLVGAHTALNRYKQHRAKMNAEVLQIQARGEKHGYANRLNTALLQDHEVSQELIKTATDTLLARSGGRGRKLGAGRPKGGGKPMEAVTDATMKAHERAVKILQTPQAEVEERLQEAFDRERNRRVRAQARPDDLSPEVADFSEHDVSYFKDIAERSEGQKGITAEEAQGVAARVQESLPDNVNVTYAATVEDIPPRMRAALEKKGVNFDTLQGAVFPSGEVLVVGENHANVADLEETFAHELVGHYGVDTILGREGMASFAKRLFGRGNDYVNELAQALHVQDTVTPDMVAAATTPEAQVALARELIAHTAEGRRVAPRFVDRVKQFVRDMVQAVRGAFARMGLGSMAQKDAQAIYQLIRDAHKQLATGRLGEYQRVGQTALRDKQSVLPAGFEKTGKAITSIVAQDQSKVDTFRKEGLLGFETNYLDQLAPVKRIASRMDDTNAAMQMLYYLQRHTKMLTMASTSARYGALKLIKLANGQYRIGSGNGSSLKTVDDKLKPLTSLGFTAKQAGNMFTLYLAGLRARVVGFEKLNFNPEQQKEVKDAMAEIEANDAVRSVLDDARKEYNEYNKGMIDFLETTGAITKKLADQLRAAKDYIPYYRVGDNGVLNLMLDSDHPVPVGNVKRQPYLSKLVGGDERIMDYFASSMKNTMLLTNMSLQNLAVRNLAFEMDKLGLTERADPKKSGIRNGDGPDHPNVVRFKLNGEDKYVRLKTEGTAFSDIPVDLMAKGLEGIPITIPEGLKLLSLPAKLLRKGVTLNPLYPYIQLFKDSLSMGATRGVSYSNAINLIKGVNKYINGRELIEELQSRGVVSGRQFSGSIEDVAEFRRQILEGEGAIHRALAAQEANNLRAEGAVRAMLYDSYIKQGMSELEAEYMTEDAMPYSQRGLSPLMRYMSHVIPFFQAQIVGMHSLYKAFRGTAVGADKVKMREKLYTAGLMLSLGTLAYAAAVGDEDWYKKMPEETRLRNWLIKVPWADDPIAIPIPFEFGIVFKGTAEAIAQGMFDSSPEGKKMREAYASLLGSTVPGLMPQALKPAVEVGVNKDFFSGAAIESPHEEGLRPFMRYRDSTSEIAKTLGDAVGVSPLQIDHLIRGYTGTMGTTVAALVNAFTGPAAETGALPEAAESKLPIVGQLFRSADGNALVNLAVETLKEAETMNATYKEMINKGRVKEAEVFLNQNIDMISRGNMYGTLRQRLGDYKKSERAIIDDPSMSARAKRDALLELRKARNEEAEAFLQAFKTAA